MLKSNNKPLIRNHEISDGYKQRRFLLRRNGGHKDIFNHRDIRDSRDFFLTLLFLSNFGGLRASVAKFQSSVNQC